MGARSTLKWAPESAAPCKGEASEGHDAKSPCADVRGASGVLSYVYFCWRKLSTAGISISKFSINHYVPCEDHFIFFFVKSDRLGMHILQKVKQFEYWRNKDKGPQIRFGVIGSEPVGIREVQGLVWLWLLGPEWVTDYIRCLVSLFGTRTRTKWCQVSSKGKTLSLSQPLVEIYWLRDIDYGFIKQNQEFLLWKDVLWCTVNSQSKSNVSTQKHQEFLLARF